MSNIATLPTGTYDPRQLALIKRTVAADTTDDEFSQFIHIARHMRLDPLRRQIYALVYSKDNPEKRRMSIIVGIDGFRAVADRTGNYRPDEDEPQIEFDAEAKGPNNPAGIVKATVRVWKFSHGAWHKVTGVARWDEYVPLSDEWAYDPEKGKRVRTGKQHLDPKSNWHRMPCVMISKCAESVALRKAWPDDFANVHAPEEMDRAAAIDITPAEAAEQGAVEERQARIGMGKSILFDFMTGDLSPLVDVPVGKVADRVCEFIEKHKDEPSQIEAFRLKNRRSLAEFWTLSPNDALEIKKKLEAAVATEGE